MLNRPISLIPVTLREAALDSPTFRGTVVHYAEQVELVEKWLDEYVKATTKMCSGIAGLESLVNNYVAAGNPVGISESMMDHDYTLLALTRYAEGSKAFWGAVISGAQKMEQSVVEPLLTFQRKDLKAFKETRRTLETTQTRYDTLLTRHSSASKSKDPSSLREDAFQLYETRKLYIRASLDFCVAAPTFRASLDRLLTRVFAAQSSTQLKIRHTGTDPLSRHATEIDRIRAWSEGMEASESVFRRELVSARKELEEKAKREWQPARDLEEYAVSTVPYLTPRPTVLEPTSEPVPSEKQGWLFMRTLTGKPTRTTWLRRWFFVHNGIFGWLVQGYRGGAMEESEKIGVLLCNIKPAFNEDRRFCFEVKTKDTTILLQAETQAELTQWLAVFEQAKRTAVESTTSASSTQAFSIIPPSAPIPPAEPAYITKTPDGSTASSALSSAQMKDHTLGPLHISRHLHVHRGSNDEDFVLNHALTMPVSASAGSARPTSLDIAGDSPTASGTREKIAQKLKPERSLSPAPANNTPITAGTPIAGAGISALISASHNALPFHPSGDTTRFAESGTSLAPNTLVNTPAPVMLSKAAAVTTGGGDKGDEILRGHRKTQSLDTDIGMHPRVGRGNGGKLMEDYPVGYPAELKAQDIHFRTLFPGRGSGEIVLLVFRATWSATPTQDLPGRCYVTAHNIYFYSHYLGLVFTSVIPLTHITEIKASPGKDCDYIFLHLHPDPDENESILEDKGGEEERVVVRIYLEPVRLLQRRLLLLVKNANYEGEESHGAGGRMGLSEVMRRLVALEKEEEDRGADTESWEDVGMDGDMAGRRRAMSGGEVGLDANDERLSFGKVTQRGIDGRVKEVTRFKLPAVPVVYEPQGMNKKTLERTFDVSPKALFHVMFGDKSAVFQSLYFERRARDIKQGPWVKLDNSSNKLRREFKYDIDYYGLLGKQSKRSVIDYQTIEMQDDHLCYVITDCKTPWHLPHRERFMLVTKIVITHVAKSKCKFAVWVGVEWSNQPAFSKGIIQRQALDDLDLDALDLADVVADQVRKLGTENQGRTKNAIKIFGEVGGEMIGPYVTLDDVAIAGYPGTLASDLDPRAPRLPIKQRSLSKMVAETALSFAESAASSVIMWTAAGIGKAWEIVSAQRMLILFLVISMVANMTLSQRSVVSYWSEKRAARWLDTVGVAPNGIMSRAVYLKDLEEIVDNGTDLRKGGAESQCYATFRTLAGTADLNADASHASIGFVSPSTRATAKRLRLSRQHLGSYRHDLLVAMRVVNKLERDMLTAEWSNWLYEETIRCGQAQGLMNSPTRGREENETDDGTRWLVEYCGSCEEEKRVEAELGLGFGVSG